MSEATETQAGAAAGAVQLTEKAIEAIRAARQREALGPEYALRVGVVGGGCSGFSYTMSFDKPKPEDHVVEAGDVTLVVDEASLEHLAGTTLDYVVGLHGSGFRFENPKAQRTCGCGASFS